MRSIIDFFDSYENKIMVAKALYFHDVNKQIRDMANSEMSDMTNPEPIDKVEGGYFVLDKGEIYFRKDGKTLKNSSILFKEILYYGLEARIEFDKIRILRRNILKSHPPTTHEIYAQKPRFSIDCRMYFCRRCHEWFQENDGMHECKIEIVENDYEKDIEYLERPKVYIPRKEDDYCHCRRCCEEKPMIEVMKELRKVKQFHDDQENAIREKYRNRT